MYFFTKKTKNDMLKSLWIAYFEIADSKHFRLILLWAFELVNFFNRQFDHRPIKSLLYWIVFTLLLIVKICFTDLNRNFYNWDEQSTKHILTIQILWTVWINRKTTIQRHWKKFIRLKSPKRNLTMLRCNRFQIKSQIQKLLIVNFKISNLQKFQSIVPFFLGMNCISWKIVVAKWCLVSRMYKSN